MARLFQFLRRLGRASLISYAQILFSGRPWAGLLFAAASFVADPFVGLVGLVAVLAANLTALRVWHDRIRWELGLAGYNAVLLGLAIGHYLPHGRLVFLLAIGAGAVSALATEWLNHRMGRFSLPVLGLPFLGFAWLVIAFTGTGHSLTHQAGFDMLGRHLPALLAATLEVFGSVFFAHNAASGLLVLAGLLVASRISAAVGLCGALVAALLTAVHAPFSALSLNLVLAPIGLVFFIVPGRRLAWIVPAGFALTALAGFALEPVTRITGVPYLILPLIITMFTALLAGRRKLLGIELVPMAMLRSPEDNIRIYLLRQRPRLQLPFFGTWFVSQGVDGGQTHKGRLGSAWDFMVRDQRGRTFASPGYRLQDYHAFGLQVVAPAAGRVVAVENGIIDNLPGKPSKQNNWGNHVIIEHTFVEFSIVAHLRQGSVRVNHGDTVTAGTVLGVCGNSGYSGQPHIHYQLQAAAVPGSDAVPAEFHDYLVVEPDRERFVRAGRPGESMTVQPVLPQESVRQLLTNLAADAEFALGRSRVQWQSKRHGSGFRLASGSTSVSFIDERTGLSVRVRGGRTTLLGQVFAGLDFIPYYAKSGLEFESGRWRHRFGRREQLAALGDALVLESESDRTRRLVWFVLGTGIARIELRHGSVTAVAERLGSTGG